MKNRLFFIFIFIFILGFCDGVSWGVPISGPSCSGYDGYNRLTTDSCNKFSYNTDNINDEGGLNYDPSCTSYAEYDGNYFYPCVFDKTEVYANELVGCVKNPSLPNGCSWKDNAINFNLSYASCRLGNFVSSCLGLDKNSCEKSYQSIGGVAENCFWSVSSYFQQVCIPAILCNESFGVPIEGSSCNDGTLSLSCSSNKPYYCNSNKQLVSNCSSCGCASGSCNSLTNICSEEASGGGVNLIENKEFISVPCSSSCVSINLAGFNLFGGSIVKTVDGKVVNSSINNGVLSFDSGDKFFRVYISPAISSGINLTSVPNLLAGSNYSIGGVSVSDVISYDQLIALSQEYVSDYDGLKKKFGVAESFDFSISADGVEGFVMQKDIPSESAVYAKTYVESVLYSDGSIINTEFIFRVW